MKIVAVRYYDGAKEKVCRLGLADLFLELQQLLLDTRIEIAEESEANGAGTVRETIDTQFEKHSEWVKAGAGGVDWIKRIRFNQTFIARIGVEVQVSARSDLLIRDIVHLRNSLQQGEIEVGVIVVPSDRFQGFLTDRTPSLRDAIRYIEHEFKEATTFPIIVIAVEHDGVGPALAKKTTNRGTQNRTKPAKNRVAS